MNISKATFIILALIAAMATGGYEAHQVSRLRGQAGSIRQQQAPVLAEIRRLQRERDDAAARLDSLQAENARLKSRSTAAELQQLRADMVRLQATEIQKQNDPSESAVDSWLEKVDQLKQYVAQHPDAGIPEFQYLTDREWLLLAVPGHPEADSGSVLQDLKSQAIVQFALIAQNALQKYSTANDGQFPGDFAMLKPYCDSSTFNILQSRYEIKPASVLPESSVKFQDIKTSWVIAGKEPVASNTANHIAIYTNGYAYFW